MHDGLHTGDVGFHNLFVLLQHGNLLYLHKILLCREDEVSLRENTLLAEFVLGCTLVEITSHKGSLVM